MTSAKSIYITSIADIAKSVCHKKREGICKVTKKELMKQARELKNQMSTRRTARAQVKEIAQLIICKKNCNYKPMFNTKLYNELSAEYCEYLQLLA